MATEVVDTPEVVEASEAPKEEPEQASKPAEPEEEGYDASLLIMVKGKAKRPQRPNDEERNLQVQKLQEQIDKASARINEIKAILDSRGSSRGVVSPELQACRDKIQQLRAEFDTVLVSWGTPHLTDMAGRGLCLPNLQPIRQAADSSWGMMMFLLLAAHAGAFLPKRTPDTSSLTR